jgi:hypothetical protein
MDMMPPNRRCCATCKYFQPGIPHRTNNECRFFPPRTTTMMDNRTYFAVIGDLLRMIALGEKPTPETLAELQSAIKPMPALYKDVAFDVTMPELVCGQWTHKLDVATSYDIAPSSAQLIRPARRYLAEGVPRRPSNRRRGHNLEWTGIFFQIRPTTQRKAASSSSAT